MIMKSTQLKTVRAMLLAGCMALVTPLIALAEEEENISKEEIKQIVVEATEAAKEWAYKLREYQHGKAEPSAYMGIIIEPVPSVLRDYIDLPNGIGLLLPRIARDGPADKAGMKDNDIITSFDGQMIVNVSQLSTLIEMKGPGATVPVKVIRKGEELSLEVTLEERLRKGGHFMVPSAPGMPDVPNADEIGAIMESVEEWIPGSVRVFVDNNEQVHVDLEDLKENLQGLKAKLAHVKVLKAEAPHIVTEHGDHGARTTMIHLADKNVTYETDEGKVVLDSTEEGKQAMIWDASGELIYEGMLPEDYETALPEKAVKLLNTLDELNLDTEGYHFEIKLNTDDIDPLTMPEGDS
jgi:hypothetical protein